MKINNKQGDGEILITWIEAEVFGDELCNILFIFI